MPLSEEQYQQLEDWMHGETPDLKRLRELLEKTVILVEHLQATAQAQPTIESASFGNEVGKLKPIAHYNDATAMYSAVIYAQIALNAKGSLKMLDYAEEHYRKPVLERKKDG